MSTGDEVSRSERRRRRSALYASSTAPRGGSRYDKMLSESESYDDDEDLVLNNDETLEMMRDRDNESSYDEKSETGTRDAIKRRANRVGRRSFDDGIPKPDTSSMSLAEKENADKL